MSEMVLIVDWTTKVLQALVVVFLLVKFKQRKWSLFFGSGSHLKSIEDHELHSCFIAALCTVVFFHVGTVLSSHVLALELDKLELRKVYYFIMSLNSCAYSVAIFSLHRLRGCSYSNAAKRCLYLAVVTVLLCIMQLISRGIFDYNGLSPFYKVSLMVVNVTTLLVVAAYPIKLIKRLKTNAKEA
ncbi:hypothetical protein [Pseudoalteromonas luteoviolacea]|uniref:hypothetical protein n=1 Tax=Pseudoalteromonas luteoviolacea TaxID=43657 RepID=UPI001B36ADC2|nr:hypothetical protein [Pseudoalteromonas luteoviolacea]MBQ4836809.1 hypothetical protein [Pseudoalteromonas luteoviolacea]